MQTGALSILRMIALPRLILLCLALVACDAIAAGAGQSARDTTTTATAPTPPWVASARKQVGVTLIYDPAYVRLPYPGGDVPQERGVCTDVVIRALRPQGLDLQKAVHEDMRAHFRLYPKNWGLRAPDRNIDHRRVPNLQTWFVRQGWSLRPTREASSYRPGDLVTWMLPGNLPHIGIVSDRKSPTGTPLIIHNIGRGTREENILFDYPITGHYRPKLPSSAR
jgi:uncharacterized protein YijF (DUF1287 family)